MASTYSPTLRIELIGNGDQSGTWGDTTNINLGTLIEAAITGVQPITMSDANYTLTAFNGLPDEARNVVLVVSGTNTATRAVIAPSVEKTYVVKNSTTGGFGVTIRTSSGTGVTIPTATTQIVYCDGTEFYAVSAPYGGSTTGTGAAVLAVSPTFTGTPLAPTAANATSTTQIATTAFVTTAVTNATGSLGTMSTQNANAVAVTGGTINGAVIGGSNAVAATFSTATATTVALGSGWTATVSGGKLVFQSSGTTRASLDSSGNFIVTGNVTAYGTP